MLRADVPGQEDGKLGGGQAGSAGLEVGGWLVNSAPGYGLPGTPPSAALPGAAAHSLAGLVRKRDHSTSICHIRLDQVTKPVSTGVRGSPLAAALWPYGPPTQAPLHSQQKWARSPWSPAQPTLGRSPPPHHQLAAAPTHTVRPHGCARRPQLRARGNTVASPHLQSLAHIDSTSHKPTNANARVPLRHTGTHVDIKKWDSRAAPSGSSYCTTTTRSAATPVQSRAHGTDQCPCSGGANPPPPEPPPKLTPKQPQPGNPPALTAVASPLPS